MSYASDNVNDLLDGSVEQIDYEACETVERLMNILDEYREAIDAGERFLVNIPEDNTWITMTQENLDRLEEVLQSPGDEDALEGSDALLIKGVTNHGFNISVPAARDARDYV